MTDLVSTTLVHDKDMARDFLAGLDRSRSMDVVPRRRDTSRGGINCRFWANGWGDRVMSIPPEKLLADFLTQEEAAAELRICERTFDRWRRLDEGPPITKLGRRTLYRRSSLQAWLRPQGRRAHGDDEASEVRGGAK
jgi:Helix-turn-helix domain